MKKFILSSMKTASQNRRTMNKRLFNDFEKISSKAWKQKIQVDLKGADYNDTLIWKSQEGIDVKPFYSIEDLNQSVSNSCNRLSLNWNIGQTIFVNDTIQSNLKALDAINRGAEALLFIIPNKEVSFHILFQNIDLDTVQLQIQFQFLDSVYIKKLNSFLKEHSLKNYGAHVIHLDVIGNLVKSGNWFFNLKEDHKHFESVYDHTQTLSIDLSHYQNSGATIIQQLAYALAHANEYLNHLSNRNNENSFTSVSCVFKVAIGSNYFFEIAKVRALRLLWKTLAIEYDANPICKIIAQPSRRNKTLYDYNTNMLRTTTESMSAILGEADIIMSLPYDAIYHKDNEFGERIARNQLLVLKHESYFDQVSNPSEGAYYIEYLTTQLANKALLLFKNIEANGGFVNQLFEGTIQRKIKERAKVEKDAMEHGHITLLGTNKHPNADDLMKNELELYPFIKINQRKTLIEPIIEKRLSENLEQKRLKTEEQ